MTHILAIDQGTTSSRAILYDAKMQRVGSAQREFTSITLTPAGWNMTPRIFGKPSSPPVMR